MTLVAAVSYVVDYWIRYVTQVLPLLGTHRFVLIDRGPLDISLMPGPTALLAKLSRLGPAMFLNVLCSAGVETIMQRKNERSAAEVVHHQATLRELVLSSPRGVVIDTEHTMERVTLIAAVVVRASRALHHGWLDGAVYRMILDGLTTTDTKSGT